LLLDETRKVFEFNVALLKWIELGENLMVDLFLVSDVGKGVKNPV
jgi:hypothetical protein